jgi:hypothetical protein
MSTNTHAHMLQGKHMQETKQSERSVPFSNNTSAFTSPSPLRPLSLVHLSLAPSLHLSLTLVLCSNSLHHIPVPIHGLHYDTGIL